jgi:hypothetical protein
MNIESALSSWFGAGIAWGSLIKGRHARHARHCFLINFFAN